MKNICIACLIILFLSTSSFADNAVQKGLEIAVEADRRASGFGDFSATMVMILRDRKGNESHRDMRVRTMEIPHDGDMNLTVFDSPRDIKGTALLTHSHKIGDDDQWLYLPALKRVKRISARNKSGAFMGSEFSFEDLGSHEIEKYTYRYVDMEVLQGRNCFVVERYPVDKENSGYSRIVSWLDQDEYRVWKEEYYDRKSRFLKTLILADYQLYKQKIWRAHSMKMVNHQKGRETDLIWSNFIFNKGMTQHDFDRNSLKRSR